MPFPNIDPILVQLGPFAIRWYALAYVAGILLGWRYATGLLRNTALWTHRPAPFTPEQMDDLILWIAIGVIGGGRLGHVLFYTPLSQTLADPLSIFRVWE
ncbi:MAG: prolipoprotein diacylglyceryl transferase, partial [Phenylobacterium sp.]